MAKVQGKTAAAGGKKGPAKSAKNVVARLKSAVAVARKKVVAKAKPAAKAVKAAAKAAKPSKTVKPAKAAKPIPKPTAKLAKKPSKPVAAPKSMPKAKAAAPKPKVAPKPAPKPAPPKPATKVAVAPKAAPPKAVTAKPAVPAPKTLPPAATPAKAAAADDKKRVRRPRTRLTGNGVATANWFAQPGEKPRPSSFIPAPPRAEAPSLIAAPPASSDRLIRPEDVTDLAVRTVPVRVDIEQSGGRAYIGINPEEATLRVGEGIEWDFRYIGGTDVTVDEIVIEFEKPSPFSQAVFKSRKPGTARPHRQLSGAAQKAAAGKRVRYTIKAMTPFKTALAMAAPYVTVTE